MAILATWIAIYIYSKWQKRHRDEKLVEIKYSIFDSVNLLSASTTNLLVYYDRETRFENDYLLSEVNKHHFHLNQQISRYYCFLDASSNKYDAKVSDTNIDDFLCDAKRLMKVCRGIAHLVSKGSINFDGEAVFWNMKYDIYTEVVEAENIIISESEPAGVINARIYNIRDEAINDILSNVY